MVRVHWGAYTKVHLACRLLTSLVTSRDIVILVTLQSSNALHSATRTRIKITMRVDPLDPRATH